MTIDDDLFRYDLFRLLVWEGLRKNSNLSRLFLFLDVPVDPRLVSVVEYPRFMEENLEKYCVLHPLIMKKYFILFFVLDIIRII